MPLALNYILHTWIKHYRRNKGMDVMGVEPSKHDLLGFPGVGAEHPKIYIRQLWLVADNDRVPCPQFLDTNVCDLAKEVNKVVNTYVANEEKLHKGLCGSEFLKEDVEDILNSRGLGPRIWGENSGAATRLKSNLPGTYPRWGIETDSGYDKRDEDK
jgi:hypothetical protein